MNSEQLSPLPEEIVNNDLDINTKEGLQSFLRFTEDTFRDIEEAVNVYHASAPEEVAESLKNATAVYEQLKDRIDASLQIKELNEDLSDDEAETLQSEYDELFAILDALDTTFGGAESTGEEPAEAIVTESVSPGPATVVEPVSKKLGVFLATHEPKKEVESMLDKELETAPRVEETAIAPILGEPEAPINDSKLEALFVTADSLCLKAEALLKKYEEISHLTETTDALNVGQHYYQQLALSAERARATKKNLQEQRTQSPDASELVLAHFEDALEEIEDNIDQLDGGLRGFFEADEASEEETRISLLPKTTTGSIGVKAEEVEQEKSVAITVAEPTVIAPPPPQSKSRQAIHHVTIKPRPEKVERGPNTEFSLMIETVLAIPRYASFVAQNFSSPAHLQATLRREIARIDGRKESQLDGVLGVKHQSAFHTFLGSMTVPEIVAFDDMPDREALKDILREKNIKYEVYLDWIDALADMLTITHAHKDITFTELFIRHELEVLIQNDQFMRAG